ncbi:hypothetical protein Q6348_15485 [Isoptericola sp. b441]|uniref:SAF domain-containing protein n=1 Tax=Actinotalea lenta TaxID=3064654 RepID=A0ABT9DCI0_9CELL|nr:MULTISPECIES: hypothetical protein [unclassified Isoptericola]MDO8108600.1 hypothetical protein [Isoptericola sp. b441]MDO8120010.1 hypothetical protein [Isoptericola sp. b490]
MTTESPAAVRLRRPGWRDPRLLAGLALVALSVALGGYAVATAGRTVPVLATPRALVPGDEVDPGALTVREVRLAEAGALYLRADREQEDHLVAVRAVGPGEIVPLAAVAPAAALDLRTVSVTPRTAVPTGVVAGSVVDLWFVPRAGDGDEVPHQLAGGLTVVDVTDARGALSVGGSVTVHVQVPVDQLADVLGALAADGSVEVVPVAGVVPAS